MEDIRDIERGKNMKIWLVKAGEALPSDKPKDRLKRMGLLAEELERRGHYVTWFNSSFNHSRKVQRCEDDKTIDISENYQMRLIWSNSYKNVSLARIKHHVQTGKKFKELAFTMDKPDIILCSMPTIELAEAAVEYGEAMDVPVLIDIRDLWPDIFAEILPSFAGPLVKPYILHSRKRLRNLLARADGILGLTDEFLEWGLDYAGRPAGDKDRVFNMAYKSEVTQFENLYGEWPSIDEEDFVVSFFGHLGRQFNLEPVIEAAKILEDEKDIKFVICGNGESLPGLEASTEQMDNISFPGWVNQREIQALLQISSIGLAPYKRSMNFTMNVPNKFGEYLSAGLPILLGLGGAMHRLVDDNNCGFKYDNGEELARDILKLKEDKALREKMSKNAKELYERGFNSDIVYANMVEFLEDLVEDREKLEK